MLAPNIIEAFGEMTAEEQAREILKCKRNPIYFIVKYCWIENPQEQRWVRFELWPEQMQVVKDILGNQRTIILKARQLGLSWLTTALALWYMIFRPGSSIGFFSRRDDEAVLLLDHHLKGMFQRLPEWFKPKTTISNDHEFELSNGSIARAFPTSAGDGYTFTMAVVDEADLSPDLKKMLLSVEPTISQAGRLVLLSKVDKSKPQSIFKKIYRAAREGKNSWKAIFLPWYIRKERTVAWYKQEARNYLKMDGTLDGLYESYPATDEEALRPKQLDKRFAPQFIKNCYTIREALPGYKLPKELKQRGLHVYVLPVAGRRYVLGADVAEGNPNSDYSSFHILDSETWQEVARFSERVEPETYAGIIDAIGMVYNKADCWIERNNHGHAVLLWLKQNSYLFCIRDEDKKTGFLTTTKSKTLMCSKAATIFAEKGVEIYSFETVSQLQALQASDLKAPEGEHDDEALSYLISLMAATRPKASYHK